MRLVGLLSRRILESCWKLRSRLTLRLESGWRSVSDPEVTARPSPVVIFAQPPLDDDCEPTSEFEACRAEVEFCRFPKWDSEDRGVSAVAQEVELDLDPRPASNRLERGWQDKCRKLPQGGETRW